MTLRRALMTALALLTAGGALAQEQGDVLPKQLPPMPDTPARQEVGTVRMADPDTFMEEDLGLPNPVTGALVHNIGSVLVVLDAALLYDRKM